MSEKRFSIFDDDEVEDVWNELKGTIYCYDEEEAQRCENWLNNLHNQNQKLKEENEQLKKRLESSETTSDATSNYNAFLESKVRTLEEENKQLKEDNEQWERFANMEFIKGSTEISRLNEKIPYLQKKNEQLRQKIKICKDFLQQITLSDNSDELNITLWDILMENDEEEFLIYLKRKAILKEDFK